MHFSFIVQFKFPAFRFVLEREAEICSLHIRVEDDFSLLGCGGDVGRFFSTAKRPKGLAVRLNLKKTKTKRSLREITDAEMKSYFLMEGEKHFLHNVDYNLHLLLHLLSF